MYQAQNLRFHITFRLERWKLAVSKSLGWATVTAAAPVAQPSAVVSDSTRRLFASVPPAIFVFR